MLAMLVSRLESRLKILLDGTLSIVNLRTVAVNLGARSGQCVRDCHYLGSEWLLSKATEDTADRCLLSSSLLTLDP